MEPDRGGPSKLSAQAEGCPRRRPQETPGPDVRSGGFFFGVRTFSGAPELLLTITQGEQSCEI